MLVYRDMTSIVTLIVFAGRLSMEPSVFMKFVVSFKELAAPVAYGNRIRVNIVRNSLHGGTNVRANDASWVARCADIG